MEIIIFLKERVLGLWRMDRDTMVEKKMSNEMETGAEKLVRLVGLYIEYCSMMGSKIGIKYALRAV